jgi:hypothetical protein
MLGTKAWWNWGRSKRCAVLAGLALIVVAAPALVRADEATKYFDIRAQPLSEALMAFGAQAGAIVMASSELTTGKTSNPVAGQLTLQDALARLLQGTGLKFETSPTGTILIVRASPRR